MCNLLKFLDAVVLNYFAFWISNLYLEKVLVMKVQFDREYFFKFFIVLTLLCLIGLMVYGQLNFNKKIGGLVDDIKGLNESVGLSIVNNTNYGPPASSGKSFYVDPIHGKPGNNGSLLAPWKSLNDVINNGLVESQDWDILPYNKRSSVLVDKNGGAPVQSGDTIYLMDGNHGDIEIKGLYNKGNITVAAFPDQYPVINSIKVLGGSNWTFESLEYLENETSSMYEVPSAEYGPVYHVHFKYN